MQSTSHVRNHSAARPSPGKYRGRGHNRVLPARDISTPLTEHIRSTNAGRANLSTARLPLLVESYLQDCALSLYSPRTLATRRTFYRNLLWFLNHRGYISCGAAELRRFFYYLAHGHEEEGGRFGNAQLTAAVRPITIKDYYVSLRCLFDWIVRERYLEATPFAEIPKPRSQSEIKQPLSRTQLELLLQSARESAEPERNVAILSLLLDSGCRASELVSLNRSEIDLKNGCCQVLGKGDKYRTVYFGAAAVKALEEYLSEYRRDDPSKAKSVQPLFVSLKRGERLTVSGLQQLLRRLKRSTGIRVSCSPYAFRRSFAVQTLKNGANVFSVQSMLGHTSLHMTQLYCALAQADVETQHRRYSPLDNFEAAMAA